MQTRKLGAWKNLARYVTGKSFSEALIYFSINPKYSIVLLGRFPLIIHQNYISRTLVERQLYTDCFTYLAQMNVAICTIVRQSSAINFIEISFFMFS